MLRRGYEPGAGLTVAIRRFQSGVINDYITWLIAGVATLGGLLSLVIRSPGGSATQPSPGLIAPRIRTVGPCAQAPAGSA